MLTQPQPPQPWRQPPQPWQRFLPHRGRPDCHLRCLKWVSLLAVLQGPQKQCSPATTTNQRPQVQVGFCYDPSALKSALFGTWGSSNFLISNASFATQFVSLEAIFHGRPLRLGPLEASTEGRRWRNSPPEPGMTASNPRMAAKRN